MSEMEKKPAKKVRKTKKKEAVVENVFEGGDELTKEETIKKLFDKYILETACVFIEKRILVQTMKEHCIGCYFNHPSQRHHDCIMMNQQEWIENYFDKIIEMVVLDGYFIYHLALSRLYEHFREAEVNAVITVFTDPSVYFKNADWLLKIKDKYTKSL